MIISPFTPLFFEKSVSDGLPSRNEQLFANTDCILVECLSSPDEELAFSLQKEGERYRRSLVCQKWEINPDLTLQFLRIKGLENGTYRLYEGINRLESSPFRVTDEENELRNTVLVQYTNADNRHRSDTIFSIAGEPVFFTFRVPGGFKDSDWSFTVDTEQYTTSDGDLMTLYASDRVQKKFTMGCADGVPMRFAEMLNRALTCRYVYFDGVRYARVGNSVPEPTQVLEGIDSFVFKVNLQKVVHLDPRAENLNLLSLRRDYGTEVYMGENDINILTD